MPQETLPQNLARRAEDLHNNIADIADRVEAITDILEKKMQDAQKISDDDARQAKIGEITDLTLELAGVTSEANELQALLNGLVSDEDIDIDTFSDELTEYERQYGILDAQIERIKKQANSF